MIASRFLPTLRVAALRALGLLMLGVFTRPGLAQSATGIDLAMGKSHAGNFIVGVNGNYTLTVVNIGTLPTTGATTVTDTLPNGLSFISASGAGWSCGAAGQIVTCVRAAILSPAQSAKIALTVGVADAARPSTINAATVTTPGEPAGNLANNRETNNAIVFPTDPIIDLLMDKSHSGNFVVGTNATYTLAVTNIGTRTTVGAITVTDNLPTGLGFVSGTGPGWSCGAVGQLVTCTNPGPLAPNQGTTISLVVSVGAAAIPSVVNTSVVSTPNEPTGRRFNNTDSDPTPVNPVPPSPPNMAMVKSSSSTFLVGQNAIYTLTVTNVGAGPTTGITTITDVLPTGLTYVLALGTNWSCGAVGQSITCTTPTIFAPGDASVVTVIVDVGQAAVPSVSNTATVKTPGDPDPTNDPFTRTDPVRILDLAIAKSHTGNFTVGSNGTYTIDVRNVGTNPTVGAIDVVDNLPTGLSFVSATGTGWSCGAAGSVVTCTNPGPLAPGATTSITLVVGVSQAASPSVINVATVSTPRDSDPTNNTATDPTTVTPQRPNLAMVKTSTSGFVVGQNATYSLSVTNVGQGATTQASTITDVLPAGLTFVSATGPTWTCGAVGQTITCTTPTLFAPGDNSVVTVTVAVGASAAPSVTNSATVKNPDDPDPNNDTSTVTDPVKVIDLAIAKSHSGTFTVGTNGTFTLTVSNVGTNPTTGAITVVDNLPTGLSFVSATGAGWTCGAAGATVSCSTPGPMVVGSSSTITLVVAVGAAAVPSVTNVATVTTPKDAVPTNNTASDQVPVVVPSPNLAIVKSTSSATFVVGQNAVYTLDVSNVGAGSTTGPATITDVLPVGLTLISASGPAWSCGSVGQTLTCTTPTIFAPGDASAVTVTVSVGAAAAPSVTNTATVKTQGDPDPSNDTSTITTPVVATLDLAISKTHAGAFTVGVNGTYTVAVSNVGNVTTTGNITVVDTLPLGLSYVSATGAGWSCSASGNLITCDNPGPIPPGTARFITVTVGVSAAAIPSVTNVVTVSTPGDAVPTNNVAKDPTPVGSTPPPLEPDLAILKTATSDFIVGQNATYNLTVTNVGNAPTAGITTVTDILASGLTYVSGTGAGWSCGAVGATVTCTTSTVFAPGASSTIVLTVAVGPTAAPAVSNTGVVKYPGDPNPKNDSSTVTKGVAPTIDLEIVKTASSMVVGSTGTFNLRVTNVGTSNTTGLITVSDTLPAGMLYISATGPSFTCSASGQIMTCTRSAPLPPLQPLNIIVTVNVTPTVALTVKNMGVVKTPGDIWPHNDTSTVSVSPIHPPDLAMKKDTLSKPIAGQNTTFRLTITNVGKGPTTGLITVTDVLPVFFTFLSGTGPGWTCSAVAQTVTCTNPGPMNPGSVSVIDLVTRAATTLGGFSNTAVVKTPRDPNPTNDEDTIQVPDGFFAFPDLETKKVATTASFVVGQPASYTLSVRNIGTGATTGLITVTDVVPAVLTPLSASGAGWTCGIVGQTVTCTNPGPVAGGASLPDITLNVMPLAGAAPSVQNSAVAKTPDDPNPGNDTSTTTTPVGAVVDLSLTKAAVGTFQVGGQGHFTITVRNIGTNAATAPITVRDTLPFGLSFVSATGTGWACTASGGVVTCVRSTAMAANESATIDLTTAVGIGALPQVTNCANVTGTNETSTLINNRGCDNVTPVGVPLLEISKTVSKSEAEIGDVIDYTLVVRNVGTAALTDAIVVDDLPRGFAFEPKSARIRNVSSADPVGAPGPHLRFSIGTLALNSPVTITYRVRITAAAALGNNVNVAVASSSDGTRKSPEARAATRVSGGLYDERGAIVGKVYTQCNCASLMQEAGEVGIPGVRIYLEDGTSAVTDVEGKYSFYGVSSRMHVVKVDRASLPRGATMVPIANRNAFDGYSRFADVKAGEMHKADFAEGSGSADVLKLVLERRRAGEVENAGTQIRDAARAPQQAGRAGVAESGAQGSPLPPATAADSIRIAYKSQPTDVLLSTDSGTGPMRSDKVYRPLGTAGTLTDRNSQLPITPLRAIAVQQGRNPMGYGRVQIDVAAEGIPADGQTLVSVVVRSFDRDGAPLAGRVPLTLEASLGRWLGEEINAVEQGRQVVLEGGMGRYTLIAASQPGRGEIRATTPEGTQTVGVTFVPVARPLMASGLLNARIDFRSLIKGGNALASDADGFEESLRDWTFDNDSGKVRGGARGALLLKGRVLNDQLLTLSYDSERDRGRTLFRDIRPDEFFPVYGDASIREFDAQSRRRFYARLDRGTSYTMFGDFQTNKSDERRVLTAYDRSLNGALQHFEGSKGSATLFASQGRVRQVIDELPGRGISGPYVLTQSQGLINSERVEILTRDRNQPSVILSRMVMTRFADYTIEPLTGRLLMRAPVPSADANLNPVSIRVTYEAESGAADKFWVYGGDASLRVTNALEIGGTFAQDESPLQKTGLAGVNATAQLGKATYAFAEYAQSNQDGTKGDAFRAELRHQSDKVEGRVFAARSDSAFSNTSSTFFGGRTEFGGRFSATLDSKTRLIGEALHTKNNTALEGKRDGAMIAFERQINTAWRAEFGYRYAKESGNYSPYPGAAARLINRGIVDNDVSALRGRLNYTLPEKARTSLFAEYEQDIRDDSHRGAIGGEYIIANRARLYGRHEWLTSTQGAYGSSDATNQQYTVFGVDADYFRNTQMFSEYRGRDAFAGRDAEASIGLRNRWAIRPGLMVNTSFERVSPLNGTLANSASAGLGDALAATGAVEWTKPSLWKSTARLEFRNADAGDNFLASFGYARKLSRDWTLLGRTLWDVFDATQNQTRGWSQLGVAWRQTDRNKWNALVRYENRLSKFGALGNVLGTENFAHILAGLVNYQPLPRITLSGRYAGKLARDDIGTLSTRTNGQLFMGRGIFDLNRRLDLGIIGSMLATDGFAARQYGLGGELGLIVMRNLRVAGGYNLFGFTDKDLNSFGTTRKGAYLELGFKFDESLFGLGGAEVPCTNACPAGGKKE